MFSHRHCENKLKSKISLHLKSLRHFAVKCNIIVRFFSLNMKSETTSVTSKGDHLLSQRYSELYLNTPSKPLRWLSKKCRRQDLNSQSQRPLPGLIPSLMLQTARFYARLYYHVQTRAHNLLRQKVITYWVSAIVSYILTTSYISETESMYSIQTVFIFKSFSSLITA